MEGNMMRHSSPLLQALSIACANPLQVDNFGHDCDEAMIPGLSGVIRNGV